MKKFLKRNKVFVIGIIFFVIILAVIMIALWDILIPSGGSAYGNRLENIEKVLPKDGDIDKIISALEEDKKVIDANFSRSGKILNFFVDVKPGTDKKTGTTFANKILEDLTEEQQAYFDIQVYFTCKTEELKEDEDSIYPFIAYKHRTSTVFSLSN